MPAREAPPLPGDAGIPPFPSTDGTRERARRVIPRF
ncbi:hypothetical protein RKD05_003385 [Microbacterium sp. SLBN-111]